MTTDETAYMKAQILDNMRTLETDDLLRIWRQRNHEEWTDLAFEVVKEILEERLGEIPAAQPEPRKQVWLEPATIPVEQAPVPSAGEIRDFLRKQTYDTMDELDTAELIDIWLEADHEEWTGLAFEVVEQILMERNGKLPAREAEEPDEEDEDAEQDGEPAAATPARAPQAALELNPVPDETHQPGLLDALVGMHCPDCGKAISEADRVCPHCGVDLEAPLDEAALQELSRESIEKAQEGYDAGRDYKAALADCDQALQYAPNSAPAHNLRGLILDALGKTALAVKEYKEAARLDPGFSEARENLADAEAELASRDS